MRGHIAKFVIAAAITTTGNLVSPRPAEGHFFAGCKKAPCKKHVVRPFNAKLDRMAWCESSGRWFIDSNFDGGLQFTPSTWNVTGSRYRFAYLAPKLEQKYRAVIWRFKIGTWVTTAGWPRCGYA